MGQRVVIVLILVMVVMVMVNSKQHSRGAKWTWWTLILAPREGYPAVRADVAVHRKSRAAEQQGSRASNCCRSMGPLNRCSGSSRKTEDRRRSVRVAIGPRAPSE